LACNFASAVALGNSYIYTNTDPQGPMPANVRSWPWGNMTVTTFGAPAIGDGTFREQFDGSVQCKRIWVLADPITAVNPQHLGTSICLAPPPTDVLKPGERHDPETIRRYVAKRYEQWKGANPNPSYSAPATTNQRNNPNRPWAYFPNCSAMLAHLTAVPGYATAQVFKDFIPNLATYFRILQQVLSVRSQTAQSAATDLVGIVTALNQAQANAAAYYTAVETAWNAANNLRTYSPKLHGHVGLCLYLAACSKGLQSPSQQIGINQDPWPGQKSDHYC
jgi:hypothetical protein